MPRSNPVAQRASRYTAHDGIIITAASRTRRNAAGRVQFDVGRQVPRIVDGRPSLLAFFQRPLLGGAVNLPQVVDAGIGLRGGTSLHEVGNGDCRQQADNGHDNHDFHQGEARLAGGLGIFHILFLFSLILTRREPSHRRVTMITALFTYCLWQPHLVLKLAALVPKIKEKCADLASIRCAE